MAFAVTLCSTPSDSCYPIGEMLGGPIVTCPAQVLACSLPLWCAVTSLLWNDWPVADEPLT